MRVELDRVQGRHRLQSCWDCSLVMEGTKAVMQVLNCNLWCRLLTKAVVPTVFPCYANLALMLMLAVVLAVVLVVVLVVDFTSCRVHHAHCFVNQLFDEVYVLYEMISVVCCCQCCCHVVVAYCCCFLFVVSCLLWWWSHVIYCLCCCLALFKLLTHLVCNPTKINPAWSLRMLHSHSYVIIIITIIITIIIQ